MVEHPRVSVARVEPKSAQLSWESAALARQMSRVRISLSPPERVGLGRYQDSISCNVVQLNAHPPKNISRLIHVVKLETVIT